MAIEAAQRPALTQTHWRQEIIAGLISGILVLPTCLSVGVLVFGPLGPDYVAEGAAAGIFAFVIGGAISALFATSSFTITVPRASTALVLSTLIAVLLVKPAFGADPALIISTAALCVFLGGLWQIVFGVFRVARIIKFTPHPVFAGFLNGAALLIIEEQIRPLFVDASGVPSPVPYQPWVLVLVIGLALLSVFYARLALLLRLPEWAAKIPSALIAFVTGIAVFYLAKWLNPALDLGPAVGRPDVSMASPLLYLMQGKNLAQAGGAGWNILLIPLVLAVVTSLETLIALRAAQSITDLDVHPVRELTAQGLGNCAAAFLAPVANAASPTLSREAYRAGGRTRLTGIAAAATVLTFGVAFSGAVAAVPNAVLTAVLVATGVGMIDVWSLRLIARLFRRTRSKSRRRDNYDALVVVAVMGITATTTVVIGVISGCVLAALVFVINMSRPVVRRSYLGHEIFSKRTRSAEEIAVLHQTGHRRAVLQLEGVLFFGNAEDLSRQVRDLFDRVDIVVLDLRGVTDIDASGSAILGALVQTSHRRGKLLLFCNVTAEHDVHVRSLFGDAGGAEAGIKPDLETALEWVEEEMLRGGLDERSREAILPLERIDLLDDLSAAEMSELRPLLKPREFATGDAICREGDPGDRLWLLAKGSVSVRLNVDDRRGSRRIASLGRGTVVGEMALIDGNRRSASIVADEAVVCYELSTGDFDRLQRDRPGIAAKIMRNTARELARRLRRTSEDLRNATS